MSDFLDGMASYYSLEQDQFQDTEFEGELSYYGSLENVSIDSQIHSAYNKAVNKATNAARTAKSEKSSVKHLSRQIEDEEERFNHSKDEQWKLRRQIKEAKSEYKKTWPATKEAKQAKEKIKQLKEQFKTRNKSRRKLRDDITQDKTRLEEKRAEIKACQETVKMVTEYRDKLISGTRKQFDILNKLKATMDHIKGMDLNSPAITKQAKAAIVSFSQLSNQKLTISLTNPLTDKSSELMQAYQKVLASISQNDKNTIDQKTQGRIEDCKNYIETLKQYQMPEPSGR